MMSDHHAFLSGAIFGVIHRQHEMDFPQIDHFVPGVDDDGNYTGSMWIYLKSGHVFRLELHDETMKQGRRVEDIVELAKELRGGG